MDRSGPPDLHHQAQHRHTWSTDRESAGVPREDQRGRAATYHSCRKYLATMLDRTGASPGVVARILRHAEGITQARYIDADISAEVEAIQRLPCLWPEIGTKMLDSAQAQTDTAGDEPAEAMSTETIQITPRSSARPFMAGSSPTRSAGRALDPVVLSERPALADRPCRSVPSPAGVQHGNGQSCARAQSLTEALEHLNRANAALIGLLRTGVSP